MRAFEDVYKVKAGDTLTAIAKSRGYKNPGPIVAYPPNSSMFPTRASADKIRPGQRLLIPWHPDLLTKIVATSQALIDDITKTTTRLIEEQIHDKEELEEYLRKIDAINMIAQVHVSIGALVAEGMGHGGALSSREIATWLADSRVHMWAGRPRTARYSGTGGTKAGLLILRSSCFRSLDARVLDVGVRGDQRTGPRPLPVWDRRSHVPHDVENQISSGGRHRAPHRDRECGSASVQYAFLSGGDLNDRWHEVHLIEVVSKALKSCGQDTKAWTMLWRHPG